MVMSVTASAVNPNIYDFNNNGAGVGVVPDPQTTNYPGQAAIGQTLRFSFCDLTTIVNAGADTTEGTLAGATVVWSIANWTGDDMPFKIKEQRVLDGVLGVDSCFLVDYGSHKPGLLDLKLHVTYSGVGNTPTTNVVGGQSKHHNFLGIWQEIYDVTLSVDETGKQLHKQNPAKYDDPNLAGKDGVPIMAKVRGSFPLGSKAKKGGKSTVILPDDFGWLANQFAVDGGNVSFGGAGAAYRWDIHDDQVINKKTKKDVQHPYCQTFYPWTDGNGLQPLQGAADGQQGHLDSASVLLQPGHGEASDTEGACLLRLWPRHRGPLHCVGHGGRQVRHPAGVHHCGAARDLRESVHDVQHGSVASVR